MGFQGKAKPLVAAPATVSYGDNWSFFFGEHLRVKIRVLSDAMASRIAAGEVVERPASVVKELIENSLDAGASEIFVWIEKSGTAVIRVTDNGEGMAPEDLALAVERHATSKLIEDEDLFRIATLGFRGEALPSIGSIAKMTIVSRPAAAATGHRLHVDGGKKDEVHAAAAALGTTIAHAEVSTVGGLVYSVLGRVPRPGDELTLDGYRVVVERVEQRRVTEVSFEKR